MMKNEDVEIGAKVLALQNDRIRAWNDMKSRAETAMTVCDILYYRSQNMNILRYIAACQLMRGGYCTEEERKAIETCNHEIHECNKALSDCTRKACEDKIASKIAEMLSKM